MAKTASELAEFIEQQLIDIAETAEDVHAMEALCKLDKIRREKKFDENINNASKCDCRYRQQTSAPW